MISKLRVFLHILPALLGGFSTGNCKGWFSPGLAKFKTGVDTPFQIPVEELPNFPICNYVGCIAALFWVFIIKDNISRRGQLLLTFGTFLFSWILTGVSINIWMMYASRLIAGFAVGQSFLIIPVFLGEIAPDRNRGAMCAYFETSLLVGVLIANGLVAQTKLLQSSIILGLVPLVALILLYIVCPESPYFLELHGKHLEAQRSLKRLRGSEYNEKEYRQIKETVALQMTNTAKFKEVYTQKSNLRAIFIIIGTLSIQCFSGYAIFQMYLHIILQDLDNDLPINALAFSMLVIHCTTSFISTQLIDRIGKRMLVIISTFGCSLTIGVFAICQHLKYVGYFSNGLVWISIICIILFLIFHSCGIGLVPLTYTSELFPINIKMYCIFVIKLYVFLIYIFANKFHQIMISKVNPYAEYYVYTAFTLISIVFVFAVVPETKRKSFHEIQLLLGAKYKVSVIDSKSQELQKLPVVNQ